MSFPFCLGVAVLDTSDLLLNVGASAHALDSGAMLACLKDTISKEHLVVLHIASELH